MTETALAKKVQPEMTTAEQLRDQLKIVIVGHVDHGKSTLIGRMLYDTDSLPDGKFEQITASCKKRGMPFEWSFLLDALQAERDQGITIDTTQIWFKTPRRDYCIIDAPGHKEFLRNMISGAASSEAAVLIIDAKEGVKEQSKRHGYLLHLLGVRQIAVAVNKMDLVDYSEERFYEIEREYRAYLKSIGVEPTYIIPVSAREGDFIAGESDKMSWYKGPGIVEALDRFLPTAAPVELPLRLPVQDVYKFDERRIIAGRIESGSLKAGDEILVSPSNTRVRVASIENWPEDREQLKEVSAGMSVGITLEDQIFIERGEVISHEHAAPVLNNYFRARVVWLGREPLMPGKRYKVKLSTGEFQAEISKIEQVISTDDLSQVSGQQIERNGVGEVIIRARGVISLDDFADNHRTGRFVIVDGYDVAGGGIIDLQDIPDQRVRAQDVKAKNLYPEEINITPEQRALMNHHTGGILWFTGLSGSGKSTLAKELQKRLFQRGYQTYVLDGDNVRRGLNKDLGFAAEDRAENIRRVGEVASLFAEAGMIVITAFISPYTEDRRRARLCSPDYFRSIYIKADLATCEGRDPKGLYEKARKGEIKKFTGVSDPYEEPENPDLAVDTSQHSVEECVQQLIDYVEQQFVSPVKQLRANQY